MNLSRLTFQIPSLIIYLAFSVAPSSAQLSGLDRERAQTILDGVASDIRKEYYDPKFHGIDWDGKVAEAKAGIEKANSWNAAMIEIAVLIDYLNDSHTAFFPPSPQVRTDYGWQFKVIGVHRYVTQVPPHSDAEAKGVKPGDQVLTLDQIKPTRESLPKIDYAIHGLSPQKSLQVSLKEGTGSARPVDIAARIVLPRKLSELDHPFGVDWQFYQRGWWSYGHLARLRFGKLGSDAIIVKVPVFEFSDSDGEKIAVSARNHKTLILDLRGNLGGFTDILREMLAFVLDHDTKIADRVGRKDNKPLLVKTKGFQPFKGKLIVLVDSQSASASELFSRVVQLEKRGQIIGDRSAGAVMEATDDTESLGTDTKVFYGLSITSANLLMTDGKSLENVGVTPDEVALPLAADLAAGKDPVLAHALELAGITVTPAEAGALFPFEWPSL